MGSTDKSFSNTTSTMPFWKYQKWHQSSSSSSSWWQWSDSWWNSWQTKESPQMRLRAKRHDRTGWPIVRRLWMKPQTCDFHNFSFLSQLDRLQLTAVCCNRREVVKTTPHKTIFAVWISGKNSRTIQKVNKYGTVTTSECVTRRAERQAQQHRNELKHEETHEYIQWLVNAVVWTTAELVCFCSLSSLLSVSVIVPWLFSLFRYTHTVWLKFESPFIPWSSSWFMRAVSITSDLFDFSIHFTSFLIISLITFQFLLPDTFNFHDVVDKYSEHFRPQRSPI